MKKYKFDLLQSTMPRFVEKDHIIVANSLADALHKFARKHQLDAPAYWDEPSFDRNIELSFKGGEGSVKYHITW